MPGGFPLGLEYCNGTTLGASPSTTLGTTLTVSSANTKGSFVQLSPSLALDICWMEVEISSADTSPWAYAVDIAVGGSGSEKVVINNLVTPYTTNERPFAYSFPCAISAGSRLSARAQADASGSLGIIVHLFDGSFTQMEGAAGIDSIGFNTGTTIGTVVTPSATANTLGSFAQITAATSADYMGFMIGFDPDQQHNASGATYLFDMAIGPSGSEIIIVPQIWSAFVANGPHFPSPVGPFFVPIQAGTRIAMRSQASVASMQPFGVTVYGIRQ